MGAKDVRAMGQGKWFRRLGWAVAAVLALWLLAWLAVPPLVKWQVPRRLSATLGRDVTLGGVDFHPWALELVVRDLAIGPAPGAGTSAPPLLRVASVRANVALSSIWRQAPVIEALALDQPRIALTRTASGHYDIDDLIRRFAPRKDALPPETARFALYNLQVRDLALRFDDRPTGRVHVLDALNLSLPFLSNLPAQVDISVQPHLAFRLNGVAFDSAAQATPFAAIDHATLKLTLAGLDVRPYVGYLPHSLPVRLVGGTLSADLALAFTQAAKGPPTVSLSGWVAAHDLVLDNTAGVPLLAWKQVRVGLGDVQPLARKLAFDTLQLDGVQWHLDRAANGAVDPLRTGVATAASVPADPADPPAAPWDVRVAAIEIVDSQILWNDASVKPAAELRFDGLTLHAKQVQWPATAPTAFTFSTRVDAQTPAAATSAVPAPARLTVEGRASQQEAQVAITLSDLSMQTLAPYIAQAFVPRVDGRLGAQGSLTWSARPDAPALRVALSTATLDALRVQPAGMTTAAAWDSLAIGDMQLDLAARTLSIASVKLRHPDVRFARDAAGQLDVARWLRAGAPVARTPAAQRVAAPDPWHVQMHGVTLDDGLLQFTDASLHPEQHLAPARAELRQLQLAVQDLSWFGDHPTPPAKVTLSARVERPAASGRTSAQGGEIGWKGTFDANPLMASGNVRIVRFPVDLVTPWVADKLPVSLLRAEAGYVGHVDLRLAPAGLAVTTTGDALLGNVHLTTLAAAAPASAASSAAGTPPDELLGWQSLSLKGVQFALAPNATPRLDIAQVELDDLYARLVVTEQGHLNLQDFGGTDAPGATPAGDTAASAPLPLGVAVGGIRLVNGRVDYTDHFVRPNYSATLTELNGSLGAFGSATRAMAALQLHGRAAGTAILDIDGQVNPLAHPLALDIEAQATDLELAPLSPYAGKYAGYAIERGKLSMTVAYKIAADGQLQAKNQVILNQLTFGEPIASPTATKLPIRLAVALMTDRDGVIDIDLPISGSVNDPQFSVGGIVVKLIVNLLAKAVTSPFSLLSGGGATGAGPAMSAIEFKPGTTVVTDASAVALTKVAEALTNHPALQMTITGSADPQSERADWQREVIETQLRTMARAHRCTGKRACECAAGSFSSDPVGAAAGALRRDPPARQTAQPGGHGQGLAGHRHARSAAQERGRQRRSHATAGAGACDRGA